MRKLKLSALCALFLTCSVFSGRAIDASARIVSDTWSELRDTIVRKFERVHVVERVVHPEEKSLASLIHESAKTHKLPPMLLASLIVQESGHKLRTDRLRYEEHLVNRFKCEGCNDTERRILATSIGAAQIIPGFWQKFCSLESWSELLDPETNLNCAGKILRSCLDRRVAKEGRPKALRSCLSEYNGDQTGRYAAQVLGRYIDLVTDQQLG